MTAQNELIEKIKHLPEHQQMIVKSVVDELVRVDDSTNGSESTGWLGCLEHLGVEITEEDIDEARREMWGNFPREVQR